ncbi:LysR family transcriptional regulator [Paracoccus versutus]|uniref:DNA-binding transcriptional LysR family regulator n=1 Tax=Paracoccus versutus TaxID=34007 RepID=A0AAQ0HJM4_PARVE|nr:LysR substrate-binding domain-containing protein [Paracoccus versutus]KGJ06009.1 LysR family transcriptional regulator [Paracoccus versutus]REG54037.1 DNA-binding transcriptional LysR family regulator [Paracoccus versutus]WEJ79227.1 LysR family transcriptional regulator [Paracoccus versutus]
MPSIKRRYLTSLGSFATFEMAAKHLSFTLAAKELNVTQGAVSQQIRQLERALDLLLFVRKHHALELTPEGANLYSAATSGLDTISATISALIGDDGPQTVTISATDALAKYWLKPLIKSFRVEHPDVGFVVLASDADDTLRNYSEVDISILCGNERCEVGEELHFLFQEIAQPVCTPSFLAEHGPFKEVDDFNRVNLLHLHDRHWSADAIGWQPLGWPEWFRSQGAEWNKAPSSLSTNKVGMLIDATLEGEGVMLGWRPMVRAFIEQGKLVFAHPTPITAGRGNFMICKKKSLNRVGVASFVEHVLSSLQA